MFKSQAKKLNETGLRLLEKADKCTKVQDVESFIKLGAECLEKSREILSQMRSNSVLIFVECCAHLESKNSYGDYLDFCARNGLEILSEIDFKSVAP